MELTVARRKIVLVVEDEPGIARICVRTLTAEGFQVDVAVNGQVALEMWREKDYDLCISDIRTPHMTGIELFQQLAKEPTNETSIMAEVIDKQVATVVHSLQILPDWKQQMAKAAVTTYEGPKPEELRDRRRRIVRAFGDGGYSDQEYKTRLDEIDRLLQQTSAITPPDIEAAVELFSNLPMLWNEATQEERQLLLRSLVELVYVDIKTKRVTAIKPTPAFRVLYGVGINSGPDTPVKLMFSGKTPILLDLVETGEGRNQSYHTVQSLIKERRALIVEFKNVR
jgi:CheY-like chemotaxis protein